VRACVCVGYGIVICCYDESSKSSNSVKCEEFFSITAVISFSRRTEFQDVECVLRAFSKFRKETISFVMSVRLFLWNNSAPKGSTVTEVYILIVLETLVR
jgi:hypothetical protein